MNNPFSDQEDLLRRFIARNPEDMLARLALADFIEENFSDRSSLDRCRFIRIGATTAPDSKLDWCDSLFLQDCTKVSLAGWVKRELWPFICLSRKIGKVSFAEIPACQVFWKRGMIEEIRMDLCSYAEVARNLHLHIPLTEIHLNAESPSHLLRVLTDMADVLPGLKKIHIRGVPRSFSVRGYSNLAIAG